MSLRNPDDYDFDPVPDEPDGIDDNTSSKTTEILPDPDDAPDEEDE